MNDELSMFPPLVMGGMSAVALVALASFAVDRIATAVLFLLSFNRTWSRHVPDPALTPDPAAKALARKKERLAYFTIAGVLAIGILASFGNLRLLTAMGLHPQAGTVAGRAAASAAATTAPASEESDKESGGGAGLFTLVDIVFTGLLLMGGADTVSRLLRMPGAPGVPKPEPRPLEVRGTLNLEGGSFSSRVDPDRSEVEQGEAASGQDS